MCVGEVNLGCSGECRHGYALGCSLSSRDREGLNDVLYNLTGFTWATTETFAIGDVVIFDIQISASTPSNTFIVEECYNVIPYNASLPTKPTTYTYDSNVGPNQCLLGKCPTTWIGLKECSTSNTFVSAAPITHITGLTMNVNSTFRIATLLAIAPTYFSNGYEFGTICFQIISPQSPLTLPQTFGFGEDWIPGQNGFLTAGGCTTVNCRTCYTGTTTSPLQFINTSSNNVTVNYKFCNGSNASLTINAGQTLTNPPGCHNVVSFMNASPISGQVYFSGGQACTN